MSSSSDSEDSECDSDGKPKPPGLKKISRQVFKTLKEKQVTSYIEIANQIVKDNKPQIDLEVEQDMQKYNQECKLLMNQLTNSDYNFHKFNAKLNPQYNSMPDFKTNQQIEEE